MQASSTLKLVTAISLAALSASSLHAYTANKHTIKQVAAPPATTGCCLFRLGQVGQGARSVAWNPPYQNCGTNGVPMLHRTGTMTWKIGISPSTVVCNETPIIPPGSTLIATTHVIARADGFGYTQGTFSIVDPGGHTLFTGQLDANDRMGTHHAPWCTGETCDEVGHVEGSFTGLGTSFAPGWRVHAEFVGKSILPNPVQPIFITLDGDLIHC
jgi:hypothetical protein